MWDQVIQRQSLRCGIVLGAIAGVFTVTGSAFAEGLSDEDYLYLATVQHVDHKAAVLDISPMERETLHYLINDPQAATDPVTHDKKVKNALGEFLAHQLWEKSHPGQLWDAPTR
jgi:hypothetical protein